ncbi:NAD(P)-binding oxidoreductase [uncultured Roseobacter sp.]|uniref:NAD(P)-dependent oxidoreductase n=1 Tax=uncultured Roseobacter sp. TaxID=114847 RepID=UPI0026358AC5|nr:NAD(P)-binding oxidoreductase [uncultured Roseobacter sp.]
MTAPILILGATSGIGASAAKEATSRSLPVRAFARGAHKLDAADLVEPFPGDALDHGSVEAALSGVRAVIYALGIKERLSMLWEEETLFSETTRVLIPAMNNANVKRLVVVTGFGAGRSKSAMSRIERLGHRAILGRPYADKDRQEALVMESDLDWTIARPVILTNGSAAAPKVLREPHEWRNGLISRAAVATYLLDAIENDLDIRSDVVLAR